VVCAAAACVRTSPGAVPDGPFIRCGHTCRVQADVPRHSLRTITGWCSRRLAFSRLLREAVVGCSKRKVLVVLVVRAVRGEGAEERNRAVAARPLRKNTVVCGTRLIPTKTKQLEESTSKYCFYFCVVWF
jgi:hypothetical protein